MKYEKNSLKIWAGQILFHFLPQLGILKFLLPTGKNCIQAKCQERKQIEALIFIFVSCFSSSFSFSFQDRSIYPLSPTWPFCRLSHGGGSGVVSWPRWRAALSTYSHLESAHFPSSIPHLNLSSHLSSSSRPSSSSSFSFLCLYVTISPK